jgi:NAD(P)-dependent dehydrogenase (short-subunit alcohol dehydrogenase family)
LEVPVFEIDDQHILVTGGSSGFGRHFARLLAGNGASGGSPRRNSGRRLPRSRPPDIKGVWLVVQSAAKRMIANNDQLVT